MRYRLNKAFSLIEVLISVAILSGAIVFIFRAFNTSLFAGRLSQDISVGCFLVEEKLWEIEQKKKNKTPFLNSAVEEYDTGEKKINISYISADTDIPALKQLNIKVEWPERGAKPYAMDFVTLLEPVE